MRTTIKELAKILELDVSTVSRALRNDPRVKESTKDKVMKLAKEKNYRPNLAARSLVKGTTNTIWFIVPELTDPVEGHTPQFASRMLAAKGYDLLVAIHQNDFKIYERLLNRLIQGITDGVLILPDYHGKEFPAIQELIAHNYPVIFLDRYTKKTEATIVTTDNKACSEKLVEMCAAEDVELILNLFSLNDQNIVERVRLVGTTNEAKKLGIACEKAGGKRTKWRNMKLPKKIGILASHQNFIYEFVAKNQEYFKDKDLYFGAFDGWVGMPAPAKKAFLCVQDFEEICRVATERIIQKIENSEPNSREIISVPAKEFKVILNHF